MEDSQFKEDSSTMPTTTSQEAESQKLESNIPTIINDGASIEVAVRKPRGRPTGSKNKRKQPVFVTQQPVPTASVSPYVLQIASGSDIISSVTRFCNSRNTGLCVLSGSGLVSNVCFLQPNTTNTITFRGVFNLLSISATVLPPSSAMQSPFNNNGKFVVSVAGLQGQMFGGTVAGPLISAGTVYIISTSFNNPNYHQLPMELEDNNKRVQNSSGCASISTTREQLSGLQQQLQPHMGALINRRHPATTMAGDQSLSMSNSFNPPPNMVWQSMSQPHHSKPC
uniref:AT-hook motif nuclear-localized protein 28-like n=1 Tax=Erigeron canadensis TaxID=72917 RepID=UPI001CB8D146|nr:AT-hook motif nuclear-localized protein 28-like [Erigeron canadensis]